MKILLLPVTLAFATGIYPLEIYGQVESTQSSLPTEDDGFNDPDAPVPIDGGLILLLAVGAGYGLQKHRNAKNKSALKTDAER